MKKLFSRQVLSAFITITIIFSLIPAQVFAAENLTEESIIQNQKKEEEEQADFSGNLETKDGQTVKEEEVSTEQEATFLKNIDEEEFEETGDNIPNQSINEEEIEQQKQEERQEQEEQQKQEERQKQEEKQEREEKQSQEDEAVVQETEVTQTLDYEQYYEENLKLVEKYPSLDGSQSPYASRRILGKMNQNIDLENYGAVALVVGSDQSFILQFETEEMTEQAFLHLQSLAQLKYCELDTAMPETEPYEEGDRIAQDDNDWNVKMLELDQFIPYVKEKVGIRGITVCVLDTGVDATHPGLKGRIKEGIQKAAYTDTTGHGTHVAGIVARCTEGLNVRILPILGVGDWSLASSGTKLAVSKGVKVINMSFGTEYYAGELIKQDCYEAFHDAVDMALDAGVSIVVSSGNNGYENLAIEDYNECPSHLGIKDGLITVASVDREQRRAWNSGYGNAVDLAAPGVGIYSTYLYDSYKYMSGTSMAAPHVTAIVAMMRLLNPEKTPAEIENLLKSYCRDKGTKGRDNYYGQGIPQMSRAIDLTKIDKQHVWSEVYTVDKAPTCTDTGNESIHCIDCNIIKPGSMRTIKALGHDKTMTIVKASLKKSGSITTKCSRCSYSGKKTIYYPKTITLARTTYQYTGKAKKPAVTVVDSKGNVIDASNYTVQYEGERIQAGTYTVKIKFRGKNYSGTASRTFSIQDKRAYQKISTKNYEKVYGNADFKVKANLTTGDGALSFQSSDTEIATVNSAGKVAIKQAGKVIITITAADTAKYKKTSVKSTIIVYPKANSIISLKNTDEKQMKVVWEKRTDVAGYRLVYAENSSFKNLKSFTYKTNKSGQRIVNNLKKGKKYYVKICTYVVGEDGKKYYSSWSPAKSITIRK